MAQIYLNLPFILIILIYIIQLVENKRKIEFAVCSYTDYNGEEAKIYCIEGDRNYCCSQSIKNSTAKRCCNFGEFQREYKVLFSLISFVSILNFILMALIIIGVVLLIYFKFIKKSKDREKYDTSVLSKPKQKHETEKETKNENNTQIEERTDEHDHK